MNWRAWSLISCCFYLFSASVADRVTSNVLAEYLFSQCECSGNGFFSDSSGGAAPGLTKSALSSCDFRDGFTSPTTQGVLLDTTTGASDTFALTSGDGSDVFTFTPSNGVTLEHWILPKDLLPASGSRSVILSELRSDSQNILNDAPNFDCIVAFNSRKPSEVQILYSSFLLGGLDLFKFTLDSPLGENNQNDLFHVVCGMNVNNNNLEPFACLNGDCQSDGTFEAPVADFAAGSRLVALSDLAIVFGSAPAASLQLVSLHVYNRGLSESEVLQNFNDKSILKSVPVVRNDLVVEAVEDGDIKFFEDGVVFFFDNDGDLISSLLLNVTIFEESKSNVGVEFQEFSLPANVFTSSDNNCVAQVNGDFLGLATVSVTDESGCSLPAETVQICITEVNDAPVVTQSTELEIVQSTEPVEFAFIPGTDVDDSSSLSGQTAVGALNNSGFITITVDASGDLFEFNDGCTNTPVNLNSQVAIQSDGNVRLCYKKTSQDNLPDTFSFLLSDGIVQDPTTASVSLSFVSLVTACAEAGSCRASTRENTDVEVVLSATILSENIVDPVVFEITDFPTKGRLFRDSAKTIEIVRESNRITVQDVSAEGVADLRITYEPLRLFFTANADGVAVDGLGKSICDGGVASCPEVIGFSVEFNGEVQTSEASVDIDAVNNEPSQFVVLKNSFDVDSGKEETLGGSLSINSGAEGDMDKVEVSYTPSDNLQFRFPEFPLSNSPEIFFDSKCNSNELCAEKVTFTGFPSELNQIIQTILVVGSGTGVASLTVRLTDVGTDLQVITLNVQGSDDGLDFALIGGGVGGAVILFGLGFFMVSRSKKRRGSGDTDSTVADIQLFDEETPKKTPISAKKPESKPKKRLKPKPPAKPQTKESTVPSKEQRQKRLSPKPPGGKPGQTSKAKADGFEIDENI